MHMVLSTCVENSHMVWTESEKNQLRKANYIHTKIQCYVFCKVQKCVTYNNIPRIYAKVKNKQKTQHYTTTSEPVHESNIFTNWASHSLLHRLAWFFFMRLKTSKTEKDRKGTKKSWHTSSLEILSKRRSSGEPTSSSILVSWSMSLHSQGATMHEESEDHLNII